MNCEMTAMTTHTMTPKKSKSAGRTRVRGPRQHHGVGFYAAWACLIILLFITIFPFLWMLRSSLMTNAELLSQPGTI